MTIGAAPPLVVSATSHQIAASALTATAQPRRLATMPTGVADTATTVAHPAAQLATGQPYALHPPPPGFPQPGIHHIGECTPTLTPSTCRLSQQSPPPPPPGESVPLMVNSLSIPAPEPYLTQVVVDPATSLMIAVQEDSSPAPMAPTSPALSETSMPPLDTLDDPTEMEEVAAKGQGAICAVTPTPKMYVCQSVNQVGPESQQ